MANVRLPTILDYLRRIIPAPDTGVPSDADLVERFVQTRDEAAFEALVRRHAAMVWNVCRRVLRHEQDADDAFQAVFLTLVRKAHTIGRRASVASWLYKVAFRVALAAKEQTARHAVLEHQRGSLPVTEPMDLVAWNDLRAVVDEEVCRLPEKYRVPVILCYLEGKTNAEAARQLGCPCGTIVTRLAWARRRLRSRLIRRGVALSEGSLAAAFSHRAGIAAVSPPLVDATIRASLLLAAGRAGVAGAATVQAIHLSRKAMNALALTRAKLVVVVFTSVTFVAGGAGILGHQLVLSTPAMPTTSSPGPNVKGLPEAPEAPASTNAESAAQTASERSRPAEEAPPQPGKGPRLLGFLRSIDPVKGTVSFMGDDGIAFEDRTLPVAADASVTWNGRSALLTDLRPGCKMILTLSANGKSITALRAKERAPGTSDIGTRTASLRGTLKAISLGKKRRVFPFKGRSSVTVTLRIDGKDSDRTLPLGGGVEVEIDGTPSNPDDLKPGMAVWLKLSRDHHTVAQIMAKRVPP